ncbi:MAG: response regulator [Lachnospiraceae bacterium]|nr:response regulator [Lachnospiraceae bacterium]
MNHSVGISTEQRNIERAELRINCVFFVGAGIVSLLMHNTPLLPILCLLALGSSLYMVIRNKMDYVRRAFATVIFVHVIFVILYFFHPYMPLFFVSYIGMVVAAGVYGIKQIIIIPVVSNSIFWIGELLMGHGDGEDVYLHIIQYIIPIIVIYFVDYILYMWLRNREKAQESLLKTIQMLEKTERSKHGFLMNISHEIRTPVHATCGVCEALQEEEDVAYIHNYLKYIGASGLCLVGILEDLIDYSVLQTKKIPLDNQEYRTEDMINTVSNVCMALRASKRIELIFDVDATLPAVFFGDRSRVCRIIGSLINNAIKFTDEGGVRLTITQSKDIGGVSLIISVTDTGCGIESDKLKSMQETFRSNDFNVFPSEQGVGLGLFMTYYMVSMMGGNISIQSQVNKGTSVNVILPQKVMDDKAFVESYGRKTICFIEDDAIADTQISSAYEDLFAHMSHQLKTTFAYCNSMVNFQERLRNEDFENILVTAREYEGYKSYFDDLAQWHQLVIAADFDEKAYLHSNSMYMVIYPFQVASLIAAFQQQEKRTKEVTPMVEETRFVTTDAKILVVDDNQMNLQVMEQLLLPFQAKVCLANSGEEAISLVQKETFDLIFMDHMMPEMDGIETMRKIRNLPDASCCNVPIIALTANIVSGIREEFIGYGFDDFAAKPIDKCALMTLIKRYLPADKCVEEISEQVCEEEMTNRDEYDFYIGALNTKLGVTYCGGKEAYLSILEEYAKKGEKNWSRIQELFDAKQWEQYTIEVHGIKSAMLTIGAKEISKRAKRLEQAGKDKDITYILSNHEPMVDLYRRMICDLQQYFGVEESMPKVENRGTNTEALIPISADEVQQMLQDMEEMAFMLDGEGMLRVAEQMQGKSFEGKALSHLVEEYRRKVEREDYLSAWDLAQKFFGVM